MKTNELLLLTASVTVMHLISNGQLNDTLNSSNNSNRNHPNYSPNMFKMFTGGINALYNDETTKGGIDLSVQTYHYFLVTGKNIPRVKDSISADNIKRVSPLKVKDDYKGFDFFLLNRAAVNFDTTGSMASDYLSSLQASPLTLRFVKEIFLSKQHDITSFSYTPVLSVKLTGDSRLVPYNYRTDQMNVGASGNFFVTFSTQFTRLEFDHVGKEIDRGTMYIQPSFGLAIGNGELMRSVLMNPKDKVILASECRLGFKSHSKTVNDCCLLVRYALNEIIGPKLRAGLILSSFN